MTLAICIRCGAKKFGAFVRCDQCGFRPASEEDLAKSLMVTDHYFQPEALQQVASDISAGRTFEFNRQNVNQLISEIRKPGFRRMMGLEPPPDPNQGRERSKRPWWRFFS